MLSKECLQNQPTNIDQNDSTSILALARRQTDPIKSVDKVFNNFDKVQRSNITVDESSKKQLKQRPRF